MVLNIFRKLIAQNKREMGVKPIDVYTIGHILMGLITYVVLNILGVSNWCSLVGAIFWGIIWEYFENFILARIGLKFEKRKDSLENSLTDVVFTIIGGYIAFFSGIFVWYFLIGFIIMVLYNWVYYKHVMG